MLKGTIVEIAASTRKLFAFDEKRFFCVTRSEEQAKRYRQMREERDKLQHENCRLREQKDDFMEKCHRLGHEIGNYREHSISVYCVPYRPLSL